MHYMFENTTLANPDVRNWNTSSLRNVQSMFKNATAANPDLSDWVFTNLIAQYNDEVVTPEVTQPASMNNAFTGSGLSPQNYLPRYC